MYDGSWRIYTYPLKKEANLRDYCSIAEFRVGEIIDT